jgi:hypothetical protein
MGAITAENKKKWSNRSLRMKTLEDDPRALKKRLYSY